MDEEMDGNETEGGNETDEDDGEGLPGFTAVAALLAALVVAARLRR
jgi:PGF-CTERM protein